MYTIYDELELEQLLELDDEQLHEEHEQEHDELDEEHEYLTIKIFGLIPSRFENALNMLSIESFSSVVKSLPEPSSSKNFVLYDDVLRPGQ
jgi:hypothetical protein